MNKKFLLILLLVIFIGGVFLLVNKFFLHIVFRTSEISENVEVAKTSETIDAFGAKPGSCLILEEKYCELGKLTYSEDNKTAFILYKVPKDVIVFSPIDGYYSIITNSNNANDRVLFIRESKSIDVGDSVLQYQISFNGVLDPSIKESTKGSNKISKGDLIGKMSPDESVLLLLTQRLSLNKDFQMVSSFSITDLKKIPSN